MKCNCIAITRHVSSDRVPSDPQRSPVASCASHIFKPVVSTTSSSHRILGLPLPLAPPLPYSQHDSLLQTIASQLYHTFIRLISLVLSHSYHTYCHTLITRIVTLLSHDLSHSYHTYCYTHITRIVTLLSHVLSHVLSHSYHTYCHTFITRLVTLLSHVLSHFYHAYCHTSITRIVTLNYHTYLSHLLSHLHIAMLTIHQFSLISSLNLNIYSFRYHCQLCACV